MTVVLVRHGETEWSRDKRHTGVTDIPLTDVGEEQARAAGRALAGRAFALVLTSPLKRAAETARLAGLAPAEVDEDLREWNYGDVEGISTAQWREDHPGWEIWRDGPPGGETADAVGVRADRVIERALAVEDGDVALVAHGHLLRILGARWLGQPAVFGGHLALGTAAVCELGFERDRRVLEAWNVVQA